MGNDPARSTSLRVPPEIWKVTNKALIANAERRTKGMLYDARIETWVLVSFSMYGLTPWFFLVSTASLCFFQLDYCSGQLDEKMCLPLQVRAPSCHTSR